MTKGYIAPYAALQKLKMARKLTHTVYLYGATGYGKTELVKQYLSNRRYVYLSCADGDWDAAAFPAPKKMEEGGRRSVVVIDDLHRLKNEEKQQAILSLLKREDIWLILISRSQVPPWLLAAYIQTGFLIIPEEDFCLGKTEAAALLARFGAEAEPQELARLVENSRGNAYALGLAAHLMADGTRPGPELTQTVRRMLADYLENAVFIEFEPELLEFLMQISVVDEFDLPLAEMITGSRHAARLLKEAEEVGNFLTQQDGIYHLRPIMLESLRRRMAVSCGESAVREHAYNAGLYYEMHGQIPKALAMYERSGHTSRIRELLIRNARCNPGNGHYFELRKYYLQLKPEEIEGNVILMAAMSMLYSLLMQRSESEYWYDRLAAYEKTVRGGEKQEAKSHLAYLDIALPHRGSQGMLHIFKHIPVMLLEKGGLPELSVTTNLPSTMNGGKDFCHWSRYDRELAASVGKLVSGILGRYGKGLVNIALGESLYEKGGDTYEVLTLLTRGEMETLGGGMIEMAFAAVGIQVRLYLSDGDMETARLHLASFEKRVRQENALQLLPNVEALKCRLALYEGDKETVRRWMENAPDEDQEFCVLERYRYLTKVRCYISTGNYLKALVLLEKLRYYAEQCKRTYIRMEVELLTAVTRCRMGEEWKEAFLAVLREACGYKFLRLITEEGPAVNDLLRQTKKECPEDEQLDADWLERLWQEADAVAVRYPAYLKRQLSATLDFSENALAILRLQAENLSVTQIAQRLNMKSETVKYHISENYRKLGVSGKADAMLTARSLNLL